MIENLECLFVIYIQKSWNSSNSAMFLDLDSKEGFKEGGFLYISYLIKESPSMFNCKPDIKSNILQNTFCKNWLFDSSHQLP